MGLAIEFRVKQALLRSALPDGTVVLLVVLHDDHCAILRNDELVHEAGGDADGIDDAVQRFMAMTQVTDVLGGGGGDEPAASTAATESPAGLTRMDKDVDVPPPASRAANVAAAPAVTPRSPA